MRPLFLLEGAGFEDDKDRALRRSSIWRLFAARVLDVALYHQSHRDGSAVAQNIEKFFTRMC